jgi:hypothetical protein
MKLFKSIIFAATFAVAAMSVNTSNASTLSEELYQTPVIQEQVTKLEQAGWTVGESEVIGLHSSWLGMGQGGQIVLLKVTVSGGNRYMQTNHIFAVFSAGSSGIFKFKKFLDSWSLAHSENR